jgi:hypothetical protein
MFKNVKKINWYIISLYLIKLFKVHLVGLEVSTINMPMRGGVGKARKGIDTSMDDEDLQGMDNSMCLHIWALTCPCLLKPFKALCYIWFKCVSNSQLTTMLLVLNGHGCCTMSHTWMFQCFKQWKFEFFGKKMYH